MTQKIKGEMRWERASPGAQMGKESACIAGDLGSILGLNDPLEEAMGTKEPEDLLLWALERVDWSGFNPGKKNH